MQGFELSSHAIDMLTERDIQEEWLWRTINAPEKKQMGKDNNLHFTRPIEEKEGRILHVIVNPSVQPNRVITVFFDRRLRKKK